MVSLAVRAKQLFIDAECSTVLYVELPQQGPTHMDFNSSVQGFSGKRVLNVQYFHDLLIWQLEVSSGNSRQGQSTFVDLLTTVKKLT